MVIFLGFFTRKVFVDNVGLEYLGLNGLLQNILGLMTLIEGGFATSVVYNMYKPLAEDNRPKILALLQLYKRVYRWIALGIAFFSICLYPFIGYFLKDASQLSYVGLVYFIFLFNSLIGYFSAYKWSLINASQQGYRLTAINLIYQIGVSISKLVILYLTKNYILYLVVEALFNVVYNIAVVKRADQLFPYVKDKNKYSLDNDTKHSIFTNIKALFINKIGGYFMHSTDNIIISAFVGVTTVGLYSNYTLITGLVKSLVTQALDSYSESVGNLIASESTDKVYSVFTSCFFVNFLIVSIPVIILFNILTPFVDWWLGSEYRLANITVWIVLLNFFLDSIRTTALTFKMKAGIFVNDRWTPFLQGLINLLLSLLLVKIWGITGVLLATSISILSIGFWQFPRLCYKFIFHKPLWDYFRRLICYSLVAIVALLISFVLCCIIRVEGLLLRLVLNALISGVVVVLVFWLLFHRLDEYNKVRGYCLSVIRKSNCVSE